VDRYWRILEWAVEKEAQVVSIGSASLDYLIGS
jgi:hypothetical protein